jgi:hypothetical protein
MVLPEVYSVNRIARKYKNSRYNDKRENRTRALYRLKHRIIKSLEPEYDKVEIHKINQNRYYYVEIQNWCFHIPTTEIELEITPDSVRSISYKPSTKEDYMNEKKCLISLHEYGYNANSHLDNQTYQWGFLPSTGW